MSLLPLSCFSPVFYNRADMLTKYTLLFQKRNKKIIRKSEKSKMISSRINIKS